MAHIVVHRDAPGGRNVEDLTEKDSEKLRPRSLTSADVGDVSLKCSIGSVSSDVEVVEIAIDPNALYEMPEEAGRQSVEEATDEPLKELSGDRARSLLRRGRKLHPAAMLVALSVLCYSYLFARLGIMHHRNFGTWSFDMGIYDQGIWLVSRFGRTFSTVRGIEFWGQHLNLIVYALVPFYWFGAGPAFLYVVQASVVGFGAVPMYLIGRDRLKQPWIGALLALVYLMYAPVQWITQINFHPEALVITPLLFAWWFSMRRQWKSFFVALLIALSTREDTALVIILLGLVLLVLFRRGHGSENERKMALGTFGLGSVWYAFATKAFIPYFNNGQEPFYVAYFYSEYGKTMGQVVANIARHPNKVIAAAAKVDRLRFYRDLLVPLGGLPLLGLPFLSMAAPQMLASVIGSSPYARSILYQYTSIMIAPIMIAMVEGVAFLLRRRPQFWGTLAGWMLLCSFVSNVAWSPSPIGDRYVGAWARAQPCAKNAPKEQCARAQHHAALNDAIRLVPKDAALTATFALLPHLAHRRLVFDWPNPFVQAYWGNNGENPANAAVLEYLVLDRNHIGEKEQPMVSELTKPGGEFEVLLDRDQVLVAKRVRPKS
jgi:uncharacterized membrane protein